ncbi:MAG: TMEM175 family protein [Thermoplasmatota archaeon]
MPDHGEPATERETNRVEAFSDGVFAFALTLLVIDLHVPSAAAASDLGGALRAEWPAFMAFFTSFLTVLVIWVNHHNSFTYIARVDQPFLFVNGLVLLSVTLIPFSTELVAAHLVGAGGALAAAIYAGNGILLAFAVVIFWAYASGGRRLVRPGVPLETLRHIRRLAFSGPAFPILAFVLAWLNPIASLALILVGLLFYAVNAVAGPAARA